MTKEQTNCNIDSDLKKQAQDNDFELSALLEEAIRKKLNKDMTHEEIDQKITILVAQISELEDMRAELIKKEAKNREQAATISVESEIRRKEKREKRSAEIKELMVRVPELSNVDESRIHDMKYKLDFVSYLKMKHPSEDFGFMFWKMDVEIFLDLLRTSRTPQTSQTPK